MLLLLLCTVLLWRVEGQQKFRMQPAKYTECSKLLRCGDLNYRKTGITEGPELPRDQNYRETRITERPELPKNRNY